MLQNGLSKCLNNEVKIGILVDVEPFLQPYLQQKMCSVLSKYLSLFVVEARKKNREKFPPATLHQILCGILQHMRQLNSPSSY